MTIPGVGGRDIADILAPQGSRRQPLAGFDSDYADIVDYILRCTHRIWEQKDIGLIETHYGADCPVIIIYRATWPDEEIIRTTLAEMRARVRAEKITRTALIFVGRVFEGANFRDSALYEPGFAHVLRNARKKRAQTVS